MEYSYWQKQTNDKPLFPNIEWSKPEQKSRAGKLGIIGGNKLGFASVAEGYSDALKIGVGEVKILLPDNLKTMIPSTITDVIYGKSNPSGSLSKEAINEMNSLGKWSNGILLIGDAGRNSETAILYEEFVKNYEGPLVITRDAIDLFKNSAESIIERKHTLLIVSFAQLQKIFQSVYYPKIITFSMQLSNLVETLHKFTITYPICIVVFFQENMLVANNGKVTSTPFNEPMRIWKGNTAINASVYWLWNLEKTLESVTSSLLK